MSAEADSGGEESPGVLSDEHEHPPDSPDSNSADPPDQNKGLPWLKVTNYLLLNVSMKRTHRLSGQKDEEEFDRGPPQITSGLVIVAEAEKSVQQFLGLI